ncbi:hypothetical protein JK188_01825 [Providencia sp. JGM181]|uniref:hypothetical protein n=1 Tax=unclassified Providencia TaxID=2633465 RepID=UPI001BA4B308|nr:MULTISPECIES: hypothetical protein [unclassified Providencia]MBS0923215.1 hypothetical protein [Providencia sp. JGM181]MBS0931988.1 hypothetical protein [Providencia sp. JGM172]MBS0996181.1 hypothetical protein [Providencia sp. JGM178]
MDKSRQQFEEWFKKEYPLIESQPENTLLQSVKRQCLKSWQASRESLINSLEPVGYMESNGIDYINKHEFTHINAEQSDSINIPLYKLD